MTEDDLLGASDAVRYSGRPDSGRVIVNWGDDPLDCWSLGLEQATSLRDALNAGISGTKTEITL